MTQIRKAVFPVGGLGTRFLPATKSIPKEMLPVNNKPIIQHAFEEAKNAGIEQFIFITGRNKNAINNHFDNAYEIESSLSKKNKQLELESTTSWLPDAGQVIFIRQQYPLGLGHAVGCAKNVIGDEPFAVILADEMLKCRDGFLKQMIKLYNNTNANVVSVGKIDKKESGKYGIIKPLHQQDGNIIIKDMVEKPNPSDAPSDLSICGRYILSPAIFKYLTDTRPDHRGEIQITDAMKQMLQKETFYAAEFTGERFDCGSNLGYLDANISYALDNPNNKKDILQLLSKYTNY